MIKTISLVISLLVLALTQGPNCLIEEPLTNDCINSVSLASLEKEVAPYMCIIASERSLREKAQQFCKEASKMDLESGYKYLRILLLNGKFEEAFRTEYNLFFISPFEHNSALLNILKQVNSTLNSYSQEHQKMNMLNSFEKSIFYFYSNQTEKSLKHLDLHLKQNQGNMNLIYEHFLKARLLQKQYRYYDAMNYISNVLKTNKKMHPYLFHLNGNFLMHHVQFQKAIKEFEKANMEFHNLYKSNGFSFSNYNIGLCFEKLGKIQEAIKHYEKSIINLNSAEALNALGHAHYSQFEQNPDQKQLQLAQTYYNKALKVNNMYTVAIFNMGMLKLTQKKFREANQNFQKCLKMEQTYRSCSYGLIKSFYLTKNVNKAHDLINKLQKNEDILTELLAILYEMGDYKKALELLNEKDEFKSSELMEWKGFNEYALDLFEKAEKSFNRAIFLGSKKAYIYYSLGLAQLSQKKYQDCSRSFGAAQKIDPRSETKQKFQECQKGLHNEL